MSIIKIISKIPPVKKLYPFAREISERTFIRVFPNSTLVQHSAKYIELQNLYEILEKDISLKNDQISKLNNSLSIQEEWIKNMAKEIENESQLASYLLDKNFEKSLKYNKIKIAFIVFFYEHWDSFDSVYRAFLDNPNFETFVFVGPRKQFDSRWRYMNEGISYLKKKGIEGIPLYNKKKNIWLDLKKYKLDYAFLNSPWEGSWPEDYWIKNLSKFLRVCYIPYGLIAAKMQNEQFNQDFHHKCWRIFAESPFHKKLFAKYSDIKDRNVEVSGYPKLDFYNTKKINNPWDKDAKDKYKIIWAPHWTIGNTSDVLSSSFLRLYNYFYKLLKERKDIYLLIKPHPGLWPNLVKQKIMNKKQIDNLIQSFKDLPNCEFYSEPGYFPYFKYSDAMILDSISFISEYLPTKKPMLFITQGDLHKFNEYGEKIMKCLYKAWTEDEITSFINNVVADGEDKMYNSRLETIRDYIYIPREGAGHAIVNSIVKEHSYEGLQK